MTHRGGKRARKAFKKVRLPAKVKEKIEDMSMIQLRQLLLFIQALLASSRSVGVSRHRRSGAKKHSKKRSRHLSAGIHMVRVGKHMRKVNVLASGKWRFMKG